MALRNVFHWGIALLMFCLSWQCFADCTTSSTTGSFGSLSSFTLDSTAETVETGSGFSCSGAVLSVLGTTTITASIVSSAGESGGSPQMVDATTGSAIPYSICSDSQCSTPYTVGNTITWSTTSLLGLLGLFDAADGTLPFYFHTNAGINVPAGTYTDTLNINWTYTECQLGISLICVNTSGSSSSTITLTMVVTNDCIIQEAPDINFGSAALPADFSSVSGALTVRCTKNAAYTVSLTGSNPTVGNWRQMSSVVNGTTDYLQYQIAQSDGSVWTPEINNAETGTGASQSVNYTATINPQQVNEPAGTYSDTVTVTVSY